MPNALYYGDNLSVLRDSIADASVDLVYLDPPFNSNASYNVLFKAPSGEGSQAQIEAFEDTWHWNESAELAFDAVVTGPHSDAAIMLRAMRSALGENDMMAYLAMMAVRLIELHRVLKPTGSLYLHCDPVASHHLKILLDAIFGPENFLNEVIWKRTFAHGSAKRYGPVHDVILFYSRSAEYVWTNPRVPHADDYIEKHFRAVDEATGKNFSPITLTGSGVRRGESGKSWRGINPTDVGRHWALPGTILEQLGILGGTVQDRLDALDVAGRIFWPKLVDGTPRLKWFVSDLNGMAVADVWSDIAPISAQARERLGYPTQKPLALLERIVTASSNPSDTVLDPFCGCGTTVHAAQKLDRNWIGIDVTHLAIALVERRLKEAFPGITFDVHGVPTDYAGASDLAERDKHEFQKWIVATIGAQPYKAGRKGMDRGIDGYLHFRDAEKKPQFAIISVKGGGIKPGDVRDLKGTMEREKAALGLFLTLNEPTREMEREAAAAGIYESGGNKFPRLQILTAEQILAGARPKLPYGHSEGYKKAKREERDDQGSLGLD